MASTINDERAAKINQAGPSHDINEVDAAENGRYEDSADKASPSGTADNRKSTVSPMKG
jgi:hypothetical protein